MAQKVLVRLRLEDLANKPGLEMNGYEAALIPWVTGAGAMECPFQAGTVYSCLLKKTTITTAGLLPDMGAIAYETEADGDLLLVIGKVTQEFV
jgi:hypothetical protein